MRHFEREQISVEWYQVKREFITWYISVDSLTFKYHFTDMKLQQQTVSASLNSPHQQTTKAVTFCIQINMCILNQIIFHYKSQLCSVKTAWHDCLRLQTLSFQTTFPFHSMSIIIIIIVIIIWQLIMVRVGTAATCVADVLTLIVLQHWSVKQVNIWRHKSLFSELLYYIWQ